MNELSESELLLLSNFMYIAESAQEDKTVREIAEELLANGISEKSLSGGLTVESATEILTEIQKNPELCDLKVEQAINTDAVRASCLVDAEGNATVVFRGTGGTYVAWKDDVLGLLQTDTMCQQMAADFIKKDCAGYNNITVAGHSKGGNLAQYCTITCGDQIDRCISYDGQGMNEEFFEKYALEIAANQDKITAINCDREGVNTLLFLLASEVKFIETEEGANAHAPWELYRKNKDAVDEEGNFTHLVEQTDEMKLLDVIGDKIVALLGALPETQEEGIGELAAAIVGIVVACISEKVTWDDVLDYAKTLMIAGVKIHEWDKIDIVSALKDIYDTIVDYMNEKDISWETLQNSLSECALEIGTVSGTATRHTEFSVSCSGLQNSVEDMANIEKKLDAIYARLEAIELPGSLADDPGLKQALKTLCAEVQEEKGDVKACRETLSECIKCYQETEQRCVEQKLAI